jgi:hypothetical protein
MGFFGERNIARLVKNTVEKAFHRNSQLREVVPLRNGRRHDVVRVWHKNGVLAKEEGYLNDCRTASAASGMKPDDCWANTQARVVTMLCDRAARYFSTRLFSESASPIPEPQPTII